jgi:hypothetical protein
MSTDSPIVEEVRARRADISSRFNDDPHRYFEHLKELERQLQDRLVDQVTVAPSEAAGVPAKSGTR